MRIIKHKNKYRIQFPKGHFMSAVFDTELEAATFLAKVIQDAAELLEQIKMTQ